MLLPVWSCFLLKRRSSHAVFFGDNDGNAHDRDDVATSVAGMWQQFRCCSIASLARAAARGSAAAAATTRRLGTVPV